MSPSLGSQRPVVALKRSDGDFPVRQERSQGVRESLGLVQAMRAARNAEKMHHEQLQSAQLALQVVLTEQSQLVCIANPTQLTVVSVIIDDDADESSVAGELTQQ